MAQRGAQTSPDGDIEMEDVVATPIFQQVNAPMITLTSREFLVDWNDRRLRYMRLLEQSRGQMKPISLKDSFEPDVLRSLCHWQLGTTVESVTEAELAHFLQEQINAGVARGNASSIKDAFVHIQMDLTINSPSAGLIPEFRDKLSYSTVSIFFSQTSFHLANRKAAFSANCILEKPGLAIRSL